MSANCPYPLPTFYRVWGFFSLACTVLYRVQKPALCRRLEPHCFPSPTGLPSPVSFHWETQPHSGSVALAAWLSPCWPMLTHPHLNSPEIYLWPCQAPIHILGSSPRACSCPTDVQVSVIWLLHLQAPLKRWGSKRTVRAGAYSQHQTPARISTGHCVFSTKHARDHVKCLDNNNCSHVLNVYCVPSTNWSTSHLFPHFIFKMSQEGIIIINLFYRWQHKWQKC